MRISDWSSDVCSSDLKVDDGIGKPHDEASERMSRCLLAQCREAGLRRVDHVVMGTDGTNLFAVEGQLKDPAHLRTHVATAQAIRTPVEQSDERLLAASHAVIRQQESAQQRELARGPDDPGRRDRKSTRLNSSP